MVSLAIEPCSALLPPNSEMVCNSAVPSSHPDASLTQPSSPAETVSLVQAQAKTPRLDVYLRAAARSVARSGALYQAEPSLLNGGSCDTVHPPPEAAEQHPEAEFPGFQGFSARKLWYLRRFYCTYADKAKLQPLVAESGWSYNVFMLARCSDNL